MTQLVLLGAARSGITATAQALAACFDRAAIDRAAINRAAIDCGEQLGLLHRLDHAARQDSRARADLQGGAVSPAPAAAVLSALIGLLPGDAPVLYAADLLPDCPNLQAARVLLQARPDMRAVVLWRQGVDFVNSRLRAFPRSDFVLHCRTWTRAMTEMWALRAAFGARVLMLEHGQIVADPAGVGARLCSHAALPPEAAERFTQSITTNHPGRTGLQHSRAVLTPERTGWAMPEISTFHTLCAAASRRVGAQLDRGAAERNHPLDLARDLLDRGQADGNIVLDPPGAPLAAPVLSCDGAGEARAWTGPVAAGRRDRLRLRLVVEQADPPAGLRCDLLECLSRRVIFGRTLALDAQEQFELDEILPPHDGLLELAFTQQPMAPAGRFRVSLREATLSHR